MADGFNRFKKDFTIPMDELFNVEFDRGGIFIKMINDIQQKIQLPNLNLEYGGLSPLSPDISQIEKIKTDFVLIFSFNDKDNHQKMYLIINPIMFTEGSLSGYVYCINNDLFDNYMRELDQISLRVPHKILSSYIESEDVGLSFSDSQHPKYWLNFDNYKDLVIALMHISSRYKKRK